ncbi:unnamed protein product [Prunus brigantina]
MKLFRLFHSHAFRNKSPTTEYNALSRKVVDYINGIPLGLKVMGSLFLGCKSKQEWEDQLNKLKRFPSEQIKKVLRVSYDGLEENEKEIFLDIACFHKGYKRNFVKEFLDSRGFFGELGIKVLVDRSLISISNTLQDMFLDKETYRWKHMQPQGQIEMHDLVQEMGLSIAQEQRIEERSRLFNAEDVHQVFTNNQRNGHVQAISFHLSKIELHFEKMYQLKCLRVYNGSPLIVSLVLPNSLKCLCWQAYPLKSLPSKFSAQNLLVLSMPYSNVEAQLWNEDQSPVNLKWLCLSESQHLTEIPNLSLSKKIEHIDLDGCVYLHEIPSYFQHLGKLTYLSLANCKYLKNLPEMPCNLEFLNLQGTSIEELPLSVWSHEKISHLDITFCKHLKSLPSNTCKLKLSGTFSLKGCKSLRKFWELPSDTKTLKLSCKYLEWLPTTIWKLKSLESLDLSQCYNLQNFPGISEVMEHLEFLDLHSTQVEELPPSIGNLVALRELDLSWTKIKSIPASIKQTAQLSCLSLRHCKSLESLPELPPLLQCLKVHGCTSLKTVSSSSTAITQGWEEYIFSRGLHEKHIFSDCPKLDANARSNIMADAHVRIMRMATASSKFKEDKIEEKIEKVSFSAYDSDDEYESEKEFFGKRSLVAIRCWGHEIPKWFSHRSEGSSIKIELPRDWFSTDFLGFALSLVVAYKSYHPWKMKMEIGCKYNFKTSNGESHEVQVKHPLFNGPSEQSSDADEPHFTEVFVWWYNHVFEEVVEEARSPTAFYNCFTEVNVKVWCTPFRKVKKISPRDGCSSAAAADTDIPPVKDKYDVFLSFRGEDTRDNFTSHLYAALLRKNIDTYIDHRLERGDEIAPALLKAIERSKIALVIFSEDYASSTWCLKELVHILGCKKSRGQIVIPIFYRIDPSDVRKQQGTYALEDRPLKRSRDEVANWRAALKEAANISGFHDSSKTGTEADFVEEVAQDVLTKLNRESSSDLRGLFGIQRKIEKIESLLCLDSPGVCCVGIWGMGGIGKTTLADAVFHRHSSKFEVCCFLANIRENFEQTNGLHQLRNKLVGEILKQKYLNIDTPSIPPHIQDRLRRTKALILLDDVNARKQLEVLVGDHDRFCQGSRIIITARDKGLLEQKVDPEKIYNVEGLCSYEALKLFHSHAFGNKSPTTDYTELSREVVDYIKGIPLALKVMGSSFRRCKSKQEWEVQWKKVKQFPNEEIDQVLRISYNGLGKNEKEIFLDIACFHRGCKRNDVERMLDSCDFLGEAGINDLIDRSLISISYFNWEKQLEERIEMHDLVQAMGREIAREQRNRLFIAKDVYQVLTNNQSDGHVQAISIDRLEMEYANFEKMHQLRWLRVSFLDNYFTTSLIGFLGLPNSLRYLRWVNYPLKSLPSKFSAQNLVVLEMPWCKVVRLWNEDQSPKHLKRIDLKDCMHLTKVPDLSRSLQIEHIDLKWCRRLVEIPSYFQHLGKLTYLDLGRCTNLRNLPEMPCNLEFLDLSFTAIEELPSSVWSHEKISRLDIRSCKHLKSLPSNTCKLKPSLSLEGCESLCEFWELPMDTTELALSSSTIKELRNASIESAVGLTAINLCYCKSLVSLPTNICKLKSLKSLDLKCCSNFQNFPEISEVMEYLEFLNLSRTSVKELPPSIRNLVALRELDLHDCKNLEVVPDELFCLTSLQVLNLSWTEIKSLPASIKQAAQLSHMYLSHCKSLESLPELPPSLKAIDLRQCSKFQYFPKILGPMEHLELLNLSNTAVKELPQSIRNLVALKKLDLTCSSPLERALKLYESRRLHAKLLAEDAF